MWHYTTSGVHCVKFYGESSYEGPGLAAGLLPLTSKPQQLHENQITFWPNLNSMEKGLMVCVYGYLCMLVSITYCLPFYHCKKLWITFTWYCAIQTNSNLPRICVRCESISFFMHNGFLEEKLINIFSHKSVTYTHFKKQQCFFPQQNR